MITITVLGAFLAVKFPFSRLDAFKRIVPAGYRWWDTERKTWCVNPPAFDMLADAWGADFAPLPYDVLCMAYPAPLQAQTPHEWNAARHERIRRAKYGKRKAA